jgi:hypothetical protein
MSKALFSSFEFYADKFVEFEVFMASSSSFEFYAKKKPKHHHRHQAKKKVQKWRRRALLVLIWDTGASAGLTPFCSDFIDYVEVDFEVRDVPRPTKVSELALHCTSSSTIMGRMFIYRACHIISQPLM